MLKKSARLTTGQFDKLIAKGRVSHSSLFLMRALSAQADTRVSAVVPVKVAKKANKRNAGRRRIYVALRKVWSSVPAGSWAIVFAKKDISAMSPADLEADLTQLLQKGRSM